MGWTLDSILGPYAKAASFEHSVLVKQLPLLALKKS